MKCADRVYGTFYMDTILNIIKRIIPKKILNLILPRYHKIMASIAAFWYGHPSEKMIVIGVTGTNGKSTTTELIAMVLAHKGIKFYAHTPSRQVKNYKVGFTSTVKFKVGDKEWLNDKKMTMIGRFQLQKLLREMVKEGCKYAVIETSSEGVKQFRHKGINYDYLVFTNLTPEHIESHGSFENYKNAKLELFRHLEQSSEKKIKGVKIKKMIIVNGDDKYANEFLDFNVAKKAVYGIDCKDCEFRAENIKLDKTWTYFEVAGTEFKLNMLGKFNVYNAFPAIIIGQYEGMEIEKIKEALEKIKGVPGRMEFINEGQKFSVLIDYAPEPVALEKLYETIREINIKTNIAGTEQCSIPTIGNKKKFNRIIHVLGSCGGGRDKARRAILGKIAAENADIVIITNEDPYDDDPMEIINEVARGAEESLKVCHSDPAFAGEESHGARDRLQKTCETWNPSPAFRQAQDDTIKNVAQDDALPSVFKILDRRDAIKKALELAEKNDLVLITGKGAEQAICVANGKKIQWDDRDVVREEILRIMNHESEIMN